LDQNHKNGRYCFKRFDVSEFGAIHFCVWVNAGESSVTGMLKINTAGTAEHLYLKIPNTQIQKYRGNIPQILDFQ